MTPRAKQRPTASVPALARALLAACTLAIAVPLHAQTCSGGPDGGADATGAQCNTPEASQNGHPFQVAAFRAEGYELYERGHYADAVTRFRSAAELGDRRSAEMIVLMHRFNTQLYGGRVTISNAEAKHWMSVLERAAQANLSRAAALR